MIGVGLVVFVAVFADGPAHVVHERARQVAQERSDRHADGSERRRHALAADRAGARGHSRRRGRVVADAGRHPPRRQARRHRQRALRHPAGDDRQGLQGHVGHRERLRPAAASTTAGSCSRRARRRRCTRRSAIACSLLSNSRKRATVTVRGIYKDDTLLQNGMITTTLLHRLTDVSGVQTVLATVKPGSDPEEVAKRRRRPPRGAVPDRQAAVERRVQEVDRRPGQHPARADLRAARRERADLAVRHRQHAAPVGLRAHARDRHAARDRHDAPPAAAHDPLRERDHGRDRQPARPRRRRRLRLDRDEGPLQRGAGVRDPVGHARRVPGGRGASSGVLAGAWPAWRASRMRVLDALSYE